MAAPFLQEIDTFTGEDRRVDASQLGDGSPYQLNCEIVDKGTAIQTRPGWIALAPAVRHVAADLTKHPSLSSVYARDYGRDGNIFALVSGSEFDRIVAIIEHVFDDGTVIGSPVTRSQQVYPPSSDTLATMWPRGADVGGAQYEQIDWRGCLISFRDRLIAFLQHEVPIHVDSTLTGKTFGIDRPIVPPDYAAGTPNPYHNGTAQAGASTTITLAAGASAVTSAYVGSYVVIYGSTGIGQYRRITAYNGSTKVATIAPAWTTNPTSSSTYDVVPRSDILAGGIFRAVNGTAGVRIHRRADLGTRSKVDDAYNGWRITIKDGASTHSTTILDYDGDSGVAFFTSQPAFTVSTHATYIINKIVAPAAGISGTYKYKVALIDSSSRFFNEGPPSRASGAITPSSQDITLTAYNVDLNLHPSTGADMLAIYRKKVSADDTWTNYYLVGEVTLTDFEANGYADGLSDETVLGTGRILNENKFPVRGCAIAHIHLGRLYQGGQDDWEGTASVTNNDSVLTITNPSKVAGTTYYGHWIGEDRFINLAGVNYPVLHCYYDIASTSNKVILADSAREGGAAYAGSTATVSAKIPGNTQDIFASYSWFTSLGDICYSAFQYKATPKEIVSTDGKLCGLISLGDTLVAIYDNAVFAINGGTFADSYINEVVPPDWSSRLLVRGKGLVAPKTFAMSADGNLMGYAGPAGGVWRFDGLSTVSISDPTLRDRLQAFGDQPFTVGRWIERTQRYRVTFPYSDDQHFFDFDFETKDWWEGNHDPSYASLGAQGSGGAGAATPAQGHDEQPYDLGVSRWPNTWTDHDIYATPSDIPGLVGSILYNSSTAPSQFPATGATIIQIYGGSLSIEHGIAYPSASIPGPSPQDGSYIGCYFITFGDTTQDYGGQAILISDYHYQGGTSPAAYITLSTAFTVD